MCRVIANSVPIQSIFDRNHPQTYTNIQQANKSKGLLENNYEAIGALKGTHILYHECIYIYLTSIVFHFFSLLNMTFIILRS